MARALWSGAISFGLIHVPVNLHSATRASTLDLDLLDKRDFSPVGYQRVNKATGKAVDWKNIVKGYQYEKGEYVVLTDEDFRQANVEATRTIDIQGFVDREAIAPYYFDKPYYVTPSRAAEKVYSLLREALERSDKLAIATIVLRTRQHLAALMPVKGVLMLITLRYQREILAAPKAEAPAKGTRRAASATDKEVQMALRLIDAMAEAWHPEQYHDTYREDLMKRIEQKVEAGQTKTLTRPEATEERQPAGGKVIDLVALLQKSLEQRREGEAPASARRRPPRKSAARKRETRRRA